MQCTIPVEMFSWEETMSFLSFQSWNQRYPCNMWTARLIGVALKNITAKAENVMPDFDGYNKRNALISDKHIYLKEQIDYSKCIWKLFLFAQMCVTCGYPAAKICFCPLRTIGKVRNVVYPRWLESVKVSKWKYVGSHELVEGNEANDTASRISFTYKWNFFSMQRTRIQPRIEIKNHYTAGIKLSEQVVLFVFLTVTIHEVAAQVD